MKWTIRIKFLLVMSGLLASCLGVYLFMAVTVFKSDKTKLVYDLNRSQVSTLASELETGLSGVSEKLKLFAQLPVNMQKRMSESLLSADSDIVAVSIFKSGKEKALNVYTQKQYLETYGIKDNDFKESIATNKIPFENILKEGEDIWNASLPNYPPMIGYGRLVLLLDEKGIPVDQWTVVGYVKLDRFLKAVSIVNLSDIVISNVYGEVLVQKDAEELSQKPNIKDNQLFKNAKSSSTKLSVQNIDLDHEKWLAAYAKAFNGKVIVMSKAPESKVFQVVKDLSIRTLLFGSTILTLVIIAAFLISRSLTHNIALLVERMTAVSKGDLTTNIQLKGRDETVTLGTSFNQMIHDLKQSRDELEVMNRELDQKVKERTRQLEEQNRKVKEAQEALLRTTRLASMGEVAGRTAHEVLNPLTSLLTRAALMQKRAIDDYREPLHLLEEISTAWKEDFKNGGFDNLVKCWQQPSEINPSKNLFDEDLDNIQLLKKNLEEQTKEIDKDMQFIREEGDRIGKIIHGMRRLGNMKQDFRTHSMHSILSDCSSIMADLYEQKRFKIVKNFSATVDIVSVDRDEIVQAITNLMRNSLQALDISAQEGRDRKQCWVKLSTRVEDTTFIVEIEDNGIGISKEHQDNIFERKFTTKSPEEGTGLGLSISRRFLRSNSGDIEFVGSEANTKTVFRITLPIREPGQRKAIA